MNNAIEVTAGTVTKTSTGVKGALDVDVTVTIPAHTVSVKADPDEDDCLTAAAQEYFTEHPWLKDHFYGKTDGYTYLAARWEDEDDRETVLLDIPARELEGEVTLAPHEYDGRWAALGDSPACWVSGKLLDALYATGAEGREFRDLLSTIEAEAAEACDGYEPETRFEILIQDSGRWVSASEFTGESREAYLCDTRESADSLVAHMMTLGYERHQLKVQVAS